MSKAFDTYQTISEAYGSSTPSNNLFAKAIESISWNYSFESEDGLWFVNDDVTLNCSSLDPFAQDFPANVQTLDGSLFYLGSM